jgi:hypothetical protein
MAIWIILICLAAVDQELSAWNAANRKLMSLPKMTEEKLLDHGTVWNNT